MALLSLYDWIVLDCPPVTVYPDAVNLSAASGTGVLVIQAEKTRLEVVEEANSILQDSGLDLLGAVLNRRKYHVPEFIYRRL
jgi:Mrp family chromosome partitioning ATPase